MSNETENRQRQPPLLLSIYSNRKQTIYRPLDGKTHTIRIPFLVNKYVVASTHGWLVLKDWATQICYLWNPVYRLMSKLPKLQDFYSYKKCVLSKPPTEPDCHILFFSEDLLLQAFCKFGDVEFVYRSQKEEEVEDKLIAIASCQGKIYGVMKPDYTIVIIEFVGRRMEFRPILINGDQPFKVPVIKKNWVISNEIEFIESHTDNENELLFIMKNLTQDPVRDNSEYEVFRVDINRMECIEVDDIGDQVIVIGEYGTGFCCSSSGTTLKPNCIYYVVEADSCVYVYDLDDKSTISWLPPDDVDLQVYNRFWVNHKLVEFIR